MMSTMLAPGVRVRSRVTNARGVLIRRKDDAYRIVRVDNPGCAQGEGLPWHITNITTDQESDQ
jgi:hypothetical protein